MKKKIQILLIHGGMTFKKRKDYLRFLKTRPISIGKRVGWSGDYLDAQLGKNFEVIRPRMPLQDNAKYEEWKVHFERCIQYMKGGVILIGISLGGAFLAKYLSENKFPKKLLSTYLVCPPFDNTLIGEDLAGGFKLGINLSLIEKNSKNLYLLFSKDDNIVPVTHAKKYESRLKSGKIVIYKSKNGHFQIQKVPEIIRMIKNDVGKI